MTPATALPSRIWPPDISAYSQGNTGIPFVWSFVSPAPGPHLMISALTHGNEPCGAAALARLLDEAVRPRRGRLTLAFVNPDAYAAARRYIDRDLNRLWRDDWIDADTGSREAERARCLRPLLSTVDRLLDLHSTASVARPFFVLADLAKARRLADAMRCPPTQQLMPGGCLDGRHLIDYGRFSDPHDPAAALTVECGRHDDPGGGAVAFATAQAFLRAGAESPEPVSANLRIDRYRTGAPYVVRSDGFSLLVPQAGFVDVRAGDPVAVDGEATIFAPFDATIIAPRPNPGAGTVAFIWAIRVG